MHYFHVREVSVPVPVTAICVISKPLLVTASTVSVISDVTMQSANVTSVPVCWSVSKTSVRHFFTNPQPRYVAQLIYINCVYIVMMFVIFLLPLVSL